MLKLALFLQCVNHLYVLGLTWSRLESFLELCVLFFEGEQFFFIVLLNFLDFLRQFLDCNVLIFKLLLKQLIHLRFHGLFG